MSHTEKTEASPPGCVTFELELRHAPEKVWRALTDPALLDEWLLPVIGFKLEPGAAFVFKTRPQPGWDGVVHSQIVEIEAPRRLSYAWSVPGLDTLVTFTLTPTEAGTRLSLVQSGFKPDQRRELGGARYGWGMMCERLTELLAQLP